MSTDLAQDKEASGTLGYRDGRYTGGPLPNREVLLAALRNTPEAKHGAMQAAYHVWSEERKFYGCLVPKVACTSWLKLLKEQLLGLKLQDGRQVYNRTSSNETKLHFRNTRLHSEDVRAREIFLDPTFFTFAVVRHPWQRIVSAYRSKYEGRCNFDRACMAQVFGLSVLPQGVSPKTPLSFHEFVEAVAQVPLHLMDPHFRPQQLLCSLHVIPYSFVGELASVADTNFISQHLGINTTFHDAAAHPPAHKYYGGRTHKVHKCSRQTVDLVARLYAIDAALLGYNFTQAYDSCTRLGLTSLPSVDDPSE